MQQPARASWPTAFGRVFQTLREAVDCRRDILSGAGTPEDCAHAQAAKLRDASGRMGGRLRLEISVRGSVPREPSVVVANHMSYLDPLAIGQVLPMSAVAKSEINGWPALGDILEELGIVFVERGNPASGAVALRRMMRRLQAGVPVLVFPEGTTTTGEDVLPFSRGAFGMARLLRVPVIPVSLRYGMREACWVGTASLLPHVLKMHRHDEVSAEVTFGPALAPNAFSSASELADATREYIRSVLR